MATRRTNKNAAAGLTAAVGLLAGLVALPVQAQSTQQACPAPYAPIHHASSGDGIEEVPSVPGTVVSAALDVAPAPIDPAPSSTFERAGSSAQPPVGLGDLDGDGNDEYAIAMIGDAPLHAPTGTYVIDGAVPAGTYDPADVGLQIAPGFVVPLADRDGDGTDELAVTLHAQNGPGSVRLYDGAALGAALGSLPADGRSIGVLAEASGHLVALARLDTARPTLVVLESLTTTAPPPAAPTDLVLDEYRIHLLDEDADLAFTSKPHPAVLNYTGPPLPQVSTGPDGDYLVLSPADRGGAAWYLWRVDDPCGVLPTDATSTSPAPAPPAAAPATPVTGGATYTG